MNAQDLARILDVSKGQSNRRPVDRVEWVKEFCEWVKTAPLDEVQLATIYTAVGMRLRHAVCHVCRNLKPKAGGIQTIPDGDLSKPKVFVCLECKDGLR